MTSALLRHRVRVAAVPPGVLVAPVPLVLTGCSATTWTLSMIGIIVVVVAAAAVIGFASGIAMSVDAYEKWERIVSTEHRHEIRRLTEASTEIATEAARVISVARAALASLRSQLARLLRSRHVPDHPI